MMYTVTVIDSLSRSCKVDIDAANKEEAEKMVQKLYESESLEEQMEPDYGTMTLEYVLVDEKPVDNRLVQKACKCGCQQFTVKYQQVSEYNVTIDINSGEWISEESDEDVVSVDVSDNTTYVCDCCGAEYATLDDVPNVVVTDEMRS